MKLHLPKRLFVALMACCSVATSVVTTVASSTMIAGAITYSLIQEEAKAEVLEFQGTGGFVHDAGNWLREDDTLNPAWGAGGSGLFTDTPQHIMKFDDPQGSNTTAQVQFNTISLGGLWVTDASANTYTLAPNGTRSLRWQASLEADVTTMGADAVVGKTNFLINNDFNIGGTGRFQTWAYAAASNFVIASTKTLYVKASDMNVYGTAPADDFEHVVRGGGTLNLDLSTSYDLSRSSDWVVSEGSTIHMSAVGAGATVTFGALSMNDGHINMGTGNSTLTSQMVVGTAGARITGGDVAAGTKTTLTGRITLTDGGEALTLSGNFTLGADLEFDLGLGADIENGRYVLLELEDGNSELDFNIADLKIVGLDDPLRISTLQIVNNKLELTLAAVTNKILSIASGDITWDLDAATTPWTFEGGTASFSQNDVVIIGEGSDLGGTVTIAANVSPRTTTVTGGGDWEFTGSGSITAGTLIKEGAGTLTISTSNSYSGGTTLTDGTLILAADGAVGTGALNLNGADAILELTNLASLGAANISFTAGTIKYGVGMTDSLHDKLTFAAGAGTLTLDINGNDVTWGEAIAGNFSILNTGADPASFGYAFEMGTKTVGIGANATVVSTTSTTAQAAAGFNITGEGTLRIENTGTYTLYSTAGFTGTVEATNGSQQVVLNRHNTADDRFMLVTEDIEAEATNIQAIIVGGAGWNGNSTLYLSGISGYSDISVSNGTPVNRGINILMTENNTFHGNFYEANGAAGNRMGTLTIGGAFTFTWTGLTTSGTYGSIGTNAKLLVQGGTTMEFATNDAGTAGGQWADDITLESGSKLLISRTDNLGFYQLATGNEITGAGRIEVSGKAVLQGNNTYTGGTTVTSGGELTIISPGALSSGQISVETGGSLIAAGGFTQAAGQSVTNAGTLTLGGTLVLTDTPVINSGNVVFNADTLFDLSSITGVTDAGVTTYTLFTNTGTLDFSALTDTGLLDFTKILGVATEGLMWTLNDDGTITSALDPNSRTFTGGLLAWAIGSEFDGGATFENGNSVIFKTANATVDLAESITAGAIHIVGVEVDYSGGTFTLTTPSITIIDGGSFIQNDTTLSDSTVFSGELGTSLVFNIGDGNSITRNDQLVDFFGDIIVRSGELVLDDPAMNMNSLIVEAGGVLTSAGISLNTADDIAIVLQGSEDDATQQATWNTGNSTVSGSVTTSGYATINANDLLYLDDTLTSTGDLTINIDANDVELRGEVAGSGVIRKTGAGSLEIFQANQTVSHTGSLIIDEGSLVLGAGFGTTMTVALDSITMEAGTTLNTALNAAAEISSTDLILKGATVAHGNFDATGDGVVQWDELILTGDNNFTIGNKGRFEFSALTGTGNMTVGGTFTDAGQDNYISLKTIRDFEGTFTGSTNALYTTVVESVYQSAGKHGVLAGSDIRSTNFSMTGEGSLEIQTNLTASSSVMLSGGSLTILGDVNTSVLVNNSTGTVNFGSLTMETGSLLQMSYAGTFGVTTYNLTGAISLLYTNMTSVLELDATALAGVTALSIDLTGYTLDDLTNGVNLGISTEFDAADLSILGLDGYTLDDTGDFYILTATELPVVQWDPNWGTLVLASRPLDILAANDLSASIGLMAPDSIYHDTVAGKSAISLTGGGGAAVNVFGGFNNESTTGGGGNYTGDSWIELQDGTFNLIVGGNQANNWGGGTAVNFIGDSHISVTGGSVNYIIGGNYREAQDAAFTGDSYISIFNGSALKGSIIGASTTAHNDNGFYTGDTNIYVYAVLNDNSAAALNSIASNLIIGSSAWQTNGGGSSITHTGNTNITVDLSGYTGAVTEFSKLILGATYSGALSGMTLNGDSNVTIVGKEGVTFSEYIAGGSANITGTSDTTTQTGNTYVTISGDSIYSARVMGAGPTVAGTQILNGNTNVTINGGDFNNFIIGAYNQNAGTSTVNGSTNITLNGGNYAGVIGGSLLAEGTVNLNNAGGNSTSISVEGGVVEGLVIGHSRLEGGGSSLMTGSSNIVVAGGDLTATTSSIIGGADLLAAATGRVTQGGSNIILNDTGSAYGSTIIGGHRMAGTGAIAADSTLGDVSITVAGADLDATLYGGSYVERTSGTLTQGNISIALESGSVGSVYAAGYQGANGTMTTASTTIEILAGVTIDANARIDGGYQLAGTPTSSSTVTGDQTLLFSSAATDYAFDNTVSFANFKTLEVSAADSSVSISSSLGLMGSAVEKTGAGNLQLAAVDHDTALTVSAGTVKLAANSQSNSITSINVASGATLDMTAASTGINGDLTLRGGSSLAITTGVGGASIGGGSLTLIGAETNRITLDISGLTYTAGMDITETLFSDILSGDQIDGIDLTQLLDNGMRGILASDYLTITGITDLSGLYIAYDEDNNSLILTNVINSTLIWGGGNGAWTGANEWTKDGNLATFEDDDNVIFNASTDELTGTVTVGADVTVSDMTFEGNGSPDANVAYTFNGALITVTGDLSVLEGASATFANIGLDDADVVIGASSTLTLLGGSMVNSLDNEGTLSVGSVGNPRDFTISNATDNGGTLDVSGNLTLAGGDTFDALTVGGNVISTGALSMAQGSSITGAFGGTGLTITGTEAASSTTVGSITNALATLTNANGSLTIGTTVSVGEFVNAGHVALQTADGKKYALAITSATSQGGDITASSLTLAGDATATNTFGVIDIASNVTTDSQLSVEVGSTIGGALTAEGLTVTGGDTTSTTSIGSVTGDLTSLSNGAGTLSITSGDLTITESLSNTGSLSVAGALNLEAATTAGGKVTAGSLSLAGGDSFTSITTTGAITSAGALSLSEASTAASLSGVTDLTVGTSLAVSSTAMTSVTSLAGAGSLQLSGGLTTAATSSIGSLTLTDTLTLGGAMTVTGTLTTASTLTVNVSYLPTDTEVALTAATVAGLTSADFILSDGALLGLNLTGGETYTILDSNTSTLANVTLNTTGEATAAGSYEFSVSTNAEGDVILLATLVGNTWEASGSSDWNTAGNWSTGTPSASLEAIFDGSGDSTVNLSAAGVASGITVDVAAGEPTTEYSLTGAELTTGSVAVRNGKLIVDNDLTVTDDTTAIVTATGALTLDRTGELEIGTTGSITAASGSMDDTNSLTITDGGSLTVTGAFDATGVTIANDGTLSLGEGSLAEALTGTGDLEVNGGVSITTVSGDSITLNAASQLTATTVTLSGSLTGTGSLTATDVTLGTADIGALNATTLTLNAAGNDITTLQANTITFNSALASGTPLLTVSDINAITGTTIDIDMAGFDATTAIGSYTIIGNGGSTDLSWDTFDLSDADKTSFNDQLLAGNDVVLGTSSTGDLTLTITDADNRIWNTADLFAVTPGLEDADPSMEIKVIGADGKIVSYDALDTVDHVMVTEDVTVDLTGLTLDPADDQGLLLKNLAGTEGKTMSIIGDGVDDSLATLYNDVDSYAQNGLDVTDATLQVKGEAGATLELGSLTMADSALDLGDGGSMELGTATLTNTSVTVANGANLSSTGDVDLTDSSLTVDDGGTASLGNVNLQGTSSLTENTGGALTVGSLSGGVDSQIEGDITVTGTDGNFLGEYITDTDITVAAGAKQTLAADKNLNVLGNTGSEITLTMDATRNQLGSLSTTGSKVTLKGNTVAQPLEIQKDTTMTDGSLHVSLDADNMENVLNGNGGSLQNITTGTAGSSLTLTGVDIYVTALSGTTDTGVLDLSGLTGTTDLVLGTLHDNVIDNGSTVILDGLTLTRFFNNARLENGQIVVDLNTNAYGDLAITENGAAGLGMLSDAVIAFNPKLTGTTPEYKDLASVVESLNEYAAAGNNAAADVLGAAVAGSSVTALGSSMLSSVEQQMQSVRNRTTSMGGNPYVAQEGPIFNAWIAAEGGSNTLDNDGTMSGHDYSTWGGSVGFYSDLTEDVTVGMALNALSGTVSSDATDIGSGDLNTYGVAAYAVVLDARWSHTFIASASIADATLDRTVSHANGSYTTQGSTDGYGLGLMYEVGYTYALNDDSSTSWQPIFNVALIHATMNGYDESGSDAALSVGEQSSTYASFGLGGRFATTIGESTFNRDAIFSARALLKFDAGDRSTSADVAFLNDQAINGSVEGAEPGAFGIELGAGLNIPVGVESGAIFMDAGLELRSGMNNINGSVGYQLQF